MWKNREQSQKGRFRQSTNYPLKHSGLIDVYRKRHSYTHMHTHSACMCAHTYCTKTHISKDPHTRSSVRPPDAIGSLTEQHVYAFVGVSV